MGKTFKQLIEENIKIIRAYEKIEGKPWKAEGSVIELAKQVGDLSKLIMAKEGYYFPNREDIHEGYEVTDEKIADELADILRAIIRLADYYDLDLEAASTKAIEMDKQTFEDSKLLRE